MKQSQFNAYRTLVHELTGVGIAEDRKPMLNSRVSKLMRACGIDCYEAYYDRVLNNPAERALFVDRVTTHETSFSRTPGVWKYLQEQFFPTWHADHVRSCRIWSAASSTGEEAYSLAMQLCDFQTENPGFRFQIYASDISSAVVEKAEQGIYTGRNIERFTSRDPQTMAKYMEQNGESYQVTQSVRNHVHFFVQNLFEPIATDIPFDLVLLRNVLIYFSEQDQARVLANVHKAMHPEAVLIIGESESLRYVDCEFTEIEQLVYVPSSRDTRPDGACRT